VSEATSVKTKACTRCRETKPETDFHVHAKGGRRRPECAGCRQAGRSPRNETPTERLTRKLWQEYKLTLAQYMALVEAQGGVCAICGRTPESGSRLFVDHCHATGVVRALLCNTCNLAVGVYENRHHEIAAYLAEFGTGNPLLKP
jgi:hypothetical protein